MKKLFRMSNSRKSNYWPYQAWCVNSIPSSFCQNFLMECICKFNFFTCDLHFGHFLRRHPIWPLLWPYWAVLLWPFSINGQNNHYGLMIYGHKYGQMMCFLKEWPKCRSPVKKLNWYLHYIKSYGQNKFMSDLKKKLLFSLWGG